MLNSRSFSTPGRIAAAMIKARKRMLITSFSFQSASAPATTATKMTAVMNALRAVSAMPGFILPPRLDGAHVEEVEGQDSGGAPRRRLPMQERVCLDARRPGAVL